MKILTVFMVTVALLISIIIGLGYYFSISAYRGNTSAHFDGKRFQNTPVTDRKSLLDVLKWQANRSVKKWRKTQYPDYPPPAAFVNHQTVCITPIFHACTLIQTAGLNILTDPIWSERASPVTFAGPKRIRPPALALDQLPKIDIVLISHNHYDHMDLSTLQQLQKKFQPTFITGLGNDHLLRKNHLKQVIALDWWQKAPFSKIDIHFVPAQHFSGRGLFDRNYSLWGGFVIETKVGAVYFAGDTGYGPFLHEIAHRFPNIRAALLPIGAFKPREFMKSMHMNPADAVQALLDLNAQKGIGIHFDSLENLADEAQYEAGESLKESLIQHQLPPERFIAPNPGQTLCFSNKHLLKVTK